MTFRQDAQALSAYRQMLRDLGVDVDRLTDAFVIDALQQASDSWTKVEDDLGQMAATVRASCRNARSALLYTGAAGRRLRARRHRPTS